ncbi:MAG: DMT family transporter, partial [Geodermatophilaceae bacterium]|nr:DMT family transporter [Geodermatophilaceae bacterium]
MSTAAPTKPSLAAPVVSAKSWLPGFFALAAIWGSSYLFIKVGVRQLHPLHLTLFRVAIGAITLLVILVATRDRLPREPRLWGHLFVVAAFGVALPFTLFGYGEQRIDSTLAGLWNATTPLIVLPLAALVFRTEKMTLRRAVGLLLGFAGVLVLLGIWQGVEGSHLTGQLMCFAAAACYGVAIPYNKKFVTGGSQSGVALAATQLILATAQLAVVAPLVAGAPPLPWQLSGEVIGSLLALGALGTGIAFVIMFRTIRLAGAS